MSILPFRRGAGRGRGRRQRARGVVHRHFDASLLALAPARNHVRDTVAGWRLTADEQDTVVLVANELVSNAVEHGRTASRMTLRRSRRVVHVLVRDYSTRSLRPTAADDATEPAAFHGLGIVRAVSTRWGWHRHAVGKTVWATITVAAPLGFA